MPLPIKHLISSNYIYIIIKLQAFQHREPPQRKSYLFFLPDLQMRPSWVFSLLVLSLLLAKVQGIRLDRESLAAHHQQQTQKHDEESTLTEKSNNGEEAEEVILCKDEQCTGKIGRSRKLVTTSISSSHELSKNKEKKEGDGEAHSSVNGNTRSEKLGGEEEGIKVQTLATSENRVGLHHKQYPDLVDITEMDYSPARRKPPIHN